MTLSVILTSITSAIAVLVLTSFLRRLNERRAAASAGDVAADLDRLIEIEKKAAASLIDADQAEATRAEIRRRILAANRTEKPLPARRPLVEVNLAVIGVAGLLIVGFIAFYALTENPPLAASAPPEKLQAAAAVEALAAATASRPLEMLQNGEPQNRLGTVDEMIGRLVERLKRNPKDVEGWRMLGWSYLNTERFAQSATAYAKAVELSPGNAELRSAYGEALVRAAGGRVTDEAKSVFEKALQLDAKDARARFFMGLVKKEAGDKVSALDDWIEILNGADSKEPWFADVVQRATELGQEIGIDVSARLGRNSVATIGGALGRLERRQSTQAATQEKDGPTADDVRSAEAMPPADRAAIIRSMVDGLATRLEQSPDDVEGWIKLIRSRQVLGETEAAKRAFDHALDVFKSAPEKQARIVALGRETGLQ